MYNENNIGMIGGLVLWQAFQAYAEELNTNQTETVVTAQRRPMWSHIQRSLGNALIAVGSQLQPKQSATNRA